MDFTLSPEQRQFGGTLHEMLAAADGPAAARQWAAGHREQGLKIWRALADLGATALVIPAERGGLAAGPVDLVIACEEIGHHAVPGPVAESLAAVPALVSALVPGAAWLGRLAGGELLATLAAPPLVPYAADADAAALVLLVEEDTAAGSRPVGSGIAGALPASARLWKAEVAGPVFGSVDASRTLAEVAAGEFLAEGPAVGRAMALALDYGSLASAAQLIGAGQALLEAAAQHARERVQFGQPIGSFQAVKHQLADVLIALEFARPLLFGAAVALAADSPTAARDVSAARVACADAAYRAARTALQVHGAIGYTAEHDMSLFLTKVEAIRAAWGTQSYHRARVLASLRGPSSETACD